MAWWNEIGLRSQVNNNLDLRRRRSWYEINCVPISWKAVEDFILQGDEWVVHFSMQTMSLVYGVSQRAEIGSQINMRPQFLKFYLELFYLRYLCMHLPGMLYSKKCKLIRKVKVRRSAPFYAKHKRSGFCREKSPKIYMYNGSDYYIMLGQICF